MYDYDCIDVSSNGIMTTLYNWNNGLGPLLATPIYPGGSLSVPRDGITLMAGDELYPSLNGSMVVLSFGVSVLAAWSCFILCMCAPSLRPFSSCYAQSTCVIHYSGTSVI
jgi:hypothetical protein